MAEQHDSLSRVVETLKRPVPLDPRLTDRVMAAVEALPAPSAPRSPVHVAWSWLRRPRVVRISPLSGLAAAAVLAGLVVAGTRLATRPAERGPTALPISASQPVQFVLVAPEAASVTLVGDFNDWDASATPLMRQDGEGVWWVTVPLSPGRYRYSFVLDGGIWRPDPLAPAAEDEFGRPNSVLTIGGS